MRQWWDRLRASPRAVIAAVVAVVAIVAVGTTVAVTAGSDEPESATAAAGGPSSEDGTTSDPDADPGAVGPSARPADKDEYCPAYRRLSTRDVGSSQDEDGSVDLAELARTFDRLTTQYTRAAEVSPLSLRDDYAQALNYLREGSKAAKSRDIDLLKALVVNLESLNDSMDAIATKSASFCR